MGHNAVMTGFILKSIIRSFALMQKNQKIKAS
jgi:hypothetical protein